MDILGTLFSSENLVKVMRLFFLNPDTIFENNEISCRSKIKIESLRQEISILSKIGFIKKKMVGRGKSGWQLNLSFPYLTSLNHLVLDATPISTDNLLGKLKKTGVLKLVIVSGIFTQSEDSRVDILIVGNSMRKKAIEKTLKDVESLVGKELEYAVFDTKEFIYRLGMYDKFVRDILDYPHEKILDKLNI